MRTIAPMSGVSDPPDLIVISTAHPTPFPTTSDWSGWTFDMVAAIHLLDPTTAVTGLGVRLEPDSGGCIRREIIFADAGPVLHAGHLWMDRSTTLKAGLEFADDTGEVGGCF